MTWEQDFSEGEKRYVLSLYRQGRTLRSIADGVLSQNAWANLKQCREFVERTIVEDNLKEKKGRENQG